MANSQINSGDAVLVEFFWYYEKFGSLLYPAFTLNVVTISSNDGLSVA